MLGENFDIRSLATGPSTTITVTAFDAPLVKRGDYITFSFDCADPSAQLLYRALRSQGSWYDETTVTARPAHRWRWIEWLRAKWEDWIAWPFSDWRARRLT